MENHIVTYFNGHSRNPNWRYLLYLRIYKVYFSGLNFRGYTPKIWPNIWYVYVPPLNRILEISHWFFFGSVNFPLIICYMYRHGKSPPPCYFQFGKPCYFDKWAIEKPWPGARRQVLQVTPQRGGDSRDEALSRVEVLSKMIPLIGGLEYWWILIWILMNIMCLWSSNISFCNHMKMIWIDDDFRWLVLYDQSYFGWIVLVINVINHSSMHRCLTSWHCQAATTWYCAEACRWLRDVVKSGKSVGFSTGVGDLPGLVMTNSSPWKITMALIEIDDVPSEFETSMVGDFPVRYVSHNQMVHGFTSKHRDWSNKTMGIAMIAPTKNW